MEILDEDYSFGFLPYPQMTAESLQMDYLYECRPFRTDPDPIGFVRFVIGGPTLCSQIGDYQKK